MDRLNLSLEWTYHVQQLSCQLGRRNNWHDIWASQRK